MRWNQKEYKQCGKTLVRRHYMKTIIICLVLLMLGGEFAGTREIMTESTQPIHPVVGGMELPGYFEPSRTIIDFVDGILIRRGAVNPFSTEVVRRLRSYHPSRGVLAQFFNSVTNSGNIAVGFLNVINTMLLQNRVGGGIVILAANILSLLCLLFVGKVLSVGARRFFLEARRYQDTGLEKALFVYQMNRGMNIVRVMFRTMLYQLLWSLTIVGGVIKMYSYYMVPFILAENPDVTGKEAIGLSRRMMNGYKWKMFVLDLSYIGWNLLNFLSFGLVGIFFLNAYRTSVDAEIYIRLRRQAKAAAIPGAEVFADLYLDIEKAAVPKYPAEVYFLPQPARRHYLLFDYTRRYSVCHLILLFFIFAFVGWCWEVFLHLIGEGVFIKRGVLLGPYLPIYGFGGVLVLVVLRPFRKQMLKTFFSSIIICGALEYFASWFLEVRYGRKWWDYTGYLLNLNGRICLEGLIVFGVGACIMIYILAPLFDALLCRIPLRILRILACVLLLCFLADNIHAQKHPNIGKGITDYAYERVYDVSVK